MNLNFKHFSCQSSKNEDLRIKIYQFFAGKNSKFTHSVVKVIYLPFSFFRKKSEMQKLFLDAHILGVWFEIWFKIGNIIAWILTVSIDFRRKIKKSWEKNYYWNQWTIWKHILYWEPKRGGERSKFYST